MRVVMSNWRAFALAATAAFIVGFAGCTVIQPPPDFSNPPSAADVTFEEISKRYLTEMLALTPVDATALGDHRYDEHYNDVSADGYARRAGLAKQLLAQLQTLDNSQLSRAHQVDAHLLRNDLEHTVWSIEQLQEWRWNPLIYTELTGNGVYSLMTRDFAPLPQRLQAVGSRLSELPR